MTDRHSGYLVTLEKDYRDDDAEPILDAIMMIKGVLTVEPIVADPTGMMAENRVKNELMAKIFAVLK